MPITALPTPPSRQDPTNFNDRADAFLGALPQFQSEANTLQTDVNANQLAATYSATLAAASELAAANTAGATLWVSGTTYAVGANRFSPINFLTYRRKTAGAGTTDPSLDATNWQLLTGLGNTTLQAVYPVGSIYINAGVTTNPATLFGFGTWVAFGAGRVMIGLNASDTLFDTLGETGGSKDAVVVAHTHTGATNLAGAHQHFTVYNGSADLPSQLTPTVYSNASLAAVGSAGYESYVLNGAAGSAANGGVTNSAGNHSHTVTTDSTGVTGANANLQPYITVCMWQRTA
jgi:hypothetical protein